MQVTQSYTVTLPDKQAYCYLCWRKEVGWWLYVFHARYVPGGA